MFFVCDLSWTFQKLRKKFVSRCNFMKSGKRGLVRILSATCATRADSYDLSGVSTVGRAIDVSWTSTTIVLILTTVLASTTGSYTWCVYRKRRKGLVAFCKVWKIRTQTLSTVLARSFTVSKVGTPSHGPETGPRSAARLGTSELLDNHVLCHKGKNYDISNECDLAQFSTQMIFVIYTLH